FPNYTEAHYNMGLVAMKLNDKRKAVDSFQQVIKLSPESEFAKSARRYMELLK
ncbi:MAG: tetratricopeptide repeat protein, partial [Deltaproteobacteria bacterium]|nr:tetratricopeptide repeat protein [Deltaproteobacteria bacterium]